MRPEIAERLLELNQTFYGQLAEPFAVTRSRPQPGFERLLAYLPEPCRRVLDVGCGAGTFGRFLSKHREVARYVGVDYSSELISQARNAVDGKFSLRNLAAETPLDGLGKYDLIACLAVLQHLPGDERRCGLVRDMRRHLTRDGRMFLSFWQFMDSERQRRKIVPWAEVGIDPMDVEAGDHLLSWRSGGFGLRYVSYIDESGAVDLAASAGLEIVDRFRSDGREGNLNLYVILRNP